MIAEEYLKNFKIDLNSLEYTGIDNKYADEYLHLIYTPKNINKDNFVFGDITITIGEDGDVMGIEDGRIYA